MKSSARIDLRASESFDRAVDVHVKNLRRKLEPDPRNPRYVLTAMVSDISLPNDQTTRARAELWAPWQTSHDWRVSATPAASAFFGVSQQLRSQRFCLGFGVWSRWVGSQSRGCSGSPQRVPLFGFRFVRFIAGVAFLRMFRRVGMPFRDVRDAAEASGGRRL